MSERRDLKRTAKLAGVAVLAVLALVIILQNTEHVTTDILFVSIAMPRALLLALTLVIGFVAGLLYGLSRGSRTHEHEH